MKKNNNKVVEKTNENYLIVYPKKVDEEVGRIINSLGFIDKEIPKDKDFSDLEEDYAALVREIDEVNEEIEKIKESDEEVFSNVAYSLDYYEKSNKMKEYMYRGKNYAYLSGWVPDSKLEELENLSKNYEGSLFSSKQADKVSTKPPTKLKNNYLTKPFEVLVNMYGTPDYKEVDPTAFFAISYLLLYGMMFGDLGQGLIFILAGFLFSKKNKTAGALLKRIGFSASFFGILYGSFFGLETVIPALLIKPFENIIQVLIVSVGFGIGLLFISYLIGIYNKVVKQEDIEEGIFGKEGLAGLMMMISFILIILNIVKVNPLPMAFGLGLLVISIGMMIFKQPIARKIEKSDYLYDQPVADYYVESSFSIIEALLSVFSNLVSFTRVGAFAINHVGLFMAFEVMADLVGGGIIGSIILVLGNVLIIGLEGMVVFIQGLRLEFYEMFSKYYKGDGHLYSPIGSYKGEN
ncbi:MAG: V-type ATPase 116kDa subunit family protein [Finegoldia sp.]|nr:V-type ATPase 116kDa subunit family protein [Finegoldia sp.]